MVVPTRLAKRTRAAEFAGLMSPEGCGGVGGFIRAGAMLGRRVCAGELHGEFPQSRSGTEALFAQRCAGSRLRQSALLLRPVQAPFHALSLSAKTSRLRRAGARR